MTGIVATVAGVPVLDTDVDAREHRLRTAPIADSLPHVDTREGRQLRRWLTQVIVTARVVAAEAERLGLRVDDAPSEDDVLPDTAARLEIGSVAASALTEGLGRALFVHVTSAVRIEAHQVADYHRRNPARFGSRAPSTDGWLGRPSNARLDDVREAIEEHLLAAARRREFRCWLDARCAEMVWLAPGYEHPGDPRQPDNVHRH